MTTATQCNQTTESGASVGTTLPYESIQGPGCFVCNWSGHLLRVPEDGVAAARSPLVNIIGCETLFVTKISDNPYIPVTKAKMVAANLDCAVSF